MRRTNGRGRRPNLILPLLAMALLLGIAVTNSQHHAAGAGTDPLPPLTVGDRAAANGDLVLHDGEVVEHNASVVIGTLEVQAGAEVKHDALVGNGSAVIGGTVDHDVSVGNGDVTLLATARVGNDIRVANGAVHQQPGAEVAGHIYGAADAGAEPAQSEGLLGGVIRLLANLALGVVFVAVGTLVILAWPRHVGRVVSVLEGTPRATVAVGVVTSIFVLPVAALLTLVLAITVIGILLIPVLWIGLILAWVYGLIAVGLWAGRRVADSGHLPAAQGSLLLTALTGLGLVALALMLLATVVPLIGWPVAYFAGFLGLGAAVLTRLGVQGSRSWPHLPHGPRHTHPLDTPPWAPPGDRQAS